MITSRLIWTTRRECMLSVYGVSGVGSRLFALETYSTLRPEMW